MDHVSEVAYWILSTVLVEAASVQQLGVRSLDAVNFLLVDLSVLVFSSDSLIVGSRPSCREGVPFVEVLQILFLKWISSNFECSEMRLVKW